MPARSHSLDVDLLDETDLEEDDFDGMSESDAVEIAKKVIEKRFRRNLPESMHYRLIDLTPAFEPLPKYRRVEVSAVVFGTPDELSTYSV